MPAKATEQYYATVDVSVIDGMPFPMTCEVSDINGTIV